MLIQNATSSPVPAPRVMNDAGGMPAVGTSESAVPIDTPKVPVANTQAAPAQPTTPAQLKDAVDSLNKAMKQINSDLEFSIDQDTKTTVVRVVDSKTGDTIKQFPSEEALAITRALDKMQGMLLKQKA
jgi:flagellar protein FlaG